MEKQTELRKHIRDLHDMLIFQVKALEDEPGYSVRHPGTLESARAMAREAVEALRAAELL